MLDLRIYRATLVLAVLGAIVTAFSLQPRPRGFATTLAPDAFDGAAAVHTLDSLSVLAPQRRPGSDGDLAVARRVAAVFRQSFCHKKPDGSYDAICPRLVRTHDVSARTIDGTQTVRTVLVSRPGNDNRQIVLLAHRDAAASPARAELSGTAALIQLAQVLSNRTTRHSVTLVSTSGGSGGLAGARDVVRQLRGPVDAVIVVGDLASASARRPLVVPWSLGRGIAPLRLQRTVQDAVAEETGASAGGSRALTQVLRLAFPFTISEQGPLGEAGLPAVLVGPGGERGPAASAKVSAERLGRFGRAVLRSVTALDSGPEVRPSAPTSYVTVKGKVLPEWGVRLLAAALLAPALLAALDALFRVRRRREPVVRWVLWVLAGAMPFVLVCGAAQLLRVAGLLDDAVGAPIRPGAVGVRLGALVVLAAIGVLSWVGVRLALVRRLGLGRGDETVGSPGSGAAVALLTVLVGGGVWLVNPYAALFLAPAAHLWLLAVAPEVRAPRGLRLALVLLGLVPFAAAIAIDALAIGAGPVQAAWIAVLALAGGVVSWGSILLWSVAGACAVAAMIVAARVTPAEPTRRGGGTGTMPGVRGPLSYAGPGSLGGTESALRR